MSTSQRAVMLCGWEVKACGLFAGKTVFPYLSALENAIVFRVTLQMSGFTLLYLDQSDLVEYQSKCPVCKMPSGQHKQSPLKARRLFRSSADGESARLSIRSPHTSCGS